MSVETEIGVGYGIIVDYNTILEIKAKISGVEWDNLLDEEILVPLNSWICDDFFIGRIKTYCCDAPIKIDNINLRFSAFNQVKISKHIESQSWSKLIEWEPHEYLLKLIR